MTNPSASPLASRVCSFIPGVAGIPNFGPVGRLDFDTSGVLLFTDDYKLKKAISSPT